MLSAHMSRGRPAPVTAAIGLLSLYAVTVAAAAVSATANDSAANNSVVSAHPIGEIVDGSDPDNVTLTGPNVCFVLKARCCNGFKLSDDKTRCLPICEKPCIHGTCILPNICLCDSLYTGPVCSKRIAICALGTYGVDCKQKCQCPNNTNCDPIEGHCYCPPGYIGPNCNDTCPTGFYGNQCQNKCNCSHGRKCNPINGTCVDRKINNSRDICGILNMWKLRFYKNYKKFCNPLYDNCRCKRTSKGPICQCEPGWIGLSCKMPCLHGTYGLNCSSNCECYNGANCRHTDGICLCTPGFYGRKCLKSCPKNFYGKLCLFKCMCDPTTEICDNIKGCIPSTELTNSTSALQLNRENRHSIWIMNLSIVFVFFIFFMIGIGMLIYYFYYYQHKMQDEYNRRKVCCSKLHENNVRRDVKNSEISIISPREQSVSCNTSYLNKMFYLTYGHNDRPYNETDENLYFEIEEIDPKREDNLYDQLDFLRPTGSWKPHYQKALVIQEQQNQSTSNTNSSRSSNSNSSSLKMQT